MTTLTRDLRSRNILATAPAPDLSTPIPVYHKPKKKKKKKKGAEDDAGVEGHVREAGHGDH